MLCYDVNVGSVIRGRWGWMELDGEDLSVVLICLVWELDKKFLRTSISYDIPCTHQTH